MLRIGVKLSGNARERIEALINGFADGQDCQAS